MCKVEVLLFFFEIKWSMTEKQITGKHFGSLSVAGIFINSTAFNFVHQNHRNHQNATMPLHNHLEALQACK